MQTVVYGISCHTADVAFREKVSVSAAQMQQALDSVSGDCPLDEVVILSTCNRTEVYATCEDQQLAHDSIHRWFASRSGVDVTELHERSYWYRGPEAVEHLLVVASSLDSMLIGDQQILGQIKTAYSAAVDAQTASSILNRLFRHALKTGKRVRGETCIGESKVSVSTVAVDVMKRSFDDLGACKVLVLGAGEMSELTMRYLVESGVHSVVIANRTYERACALAEQFDGVAARFDDIADHLIDADLIISSTASPHHVLTRELLSEVARTYSTQPLVIVDIAVPRDVDPACREIEGVTVVDMDDLQTIVAQNIEKRIQASNAARRIVDEGVADFSEWIRARSVAPTIERIRNRADSIRAAELDRLFKSLDGIDGQERARIEAMSSALVNKILHDPISRLRESAVAGDETYVAAAHGLFGLESMSIKEESHR